MIKRLRLNVEFENEQIKFNLSSGDGFNYENKPSAHIVVRETDKFKLDDIDLAIGILQKLRTQFIRM